MTILKREQVAFTPDFYKKVAIAINQAHVPDPKNIKRAIDSLRDEQLLIKEEINFLKKGGRLVFLLPRFHIIDKKNYQQYLKKNFQDQAYNY